ncbi:hypothetical protein [Myxococcus sp. SDU36]|uniref:hypothetical protein n=1 Tax=Myxococcus sp. SDU36 TaxID=2831967 RepID=UPI0025439341|nr:hypothetical protein [Myxococcus sp. SDU36]
MGSTSSTRSSSPLAVICTRPLFSRYIPSTFVATALGILFEYAVLLALTLVSWRFFEKPLLCLKDRFTHTDAAGKAVAPTA